MNHKPDPATSQSSTGGPPSLPTARCPWQCHTKCTALPSQSRRGAGGCARREEPCLQPVPLAVACGHEQRTEDAPHHCSGFWSPPLLPGTHTWPGGWAGRRRGGPSLILVSLFQHQQPPPAPQLQNRIPYAVNICGTFQEWGRGGWPPWQLGSWPTHRHAPPNTHL